MERIWEAGFSSVCDCDQPIQITFRVREYPESILSYHGYESAAAEMLVDPKIREHQVIVNI
jgi:hypothetical protein